MSWILTFSFSSIVQRDSTRQAKRMSVSHSFCPGDYGFSPLVSILSVSLCFWCCSFLFSLVQQLWRRVRVEGISCTQGCATVRLECSWGCGGTGLGFPMPIVNCWLYWKLWGDFHCPLDPCTGPWPRGCVFSPAGTLNGLCVCVVCVTGQSQEGVLLFSHKPFSHQPQHSRPPGKSFIFKRQQTRAFPIHTLNYPHFPHQFSLQNPPIHFQRTIFSSPILDDKITVCLCPSLLPSSI